jgi:5'(3')-deoxyribonucleotidase
MTKRLFIDMDGVLARFHDEENFTELMYKSGFFINLKPFKNAVEAVKQFVKNPDFEVFIISSPLNETALAEKKKWIDWHLPEISNDHRLFPKYEQSKADFIWQKFNGICKNDILFDDYNRNLQEWHKIGGTAIMCVNNTSHLRPKGMKWSGEIVSNDANCEKIIADLTNAIEHSLNEQAVILRLYNQVYPQFYGRNYYGDLEKYPEELQASDIIDQVDNLNDIIQDYDNDFTERGLMEYFRCGNDEIEKSVNSKVKSMFQHFEVIGDEVMYITECEVKEELNDAEISELKSYILGQNADGVGESFEQRDINANGGVLNVSVWSSDKNFVILTEEEFAHKSGMEYTPPIYPKNVVTERFYTSVTPHIFDPLNPNQELSLLGIKNKIGDAESVAKILNQNCSPALLTEHYNDNYAEHDKVNSINQHYEADSDEIILVTECEVAEELTEAEHKHLTEYLLDQMSDAYGEGVMKRDCNVSGINMPVQIFGNSASYELLTEAEFEQQKCQEISEEMSISM